MRLTLAACLLAVTSLFPLTVAASEPHVLETEGAAIRMSVLG